MFLLSDIRKPNIENRLDECIKYCYPNLATYYVPEKKEEQKVVYNKRHIRITITNKFIISILSIVSKRKEEIIKFKMLFDNTS